MDQNKNETGTTPPGEAPPEPVEEPTLPEPSTSKPIVLPKPISFGQTVIEGAEPPSNKRIILTEPDHSDSAPSKGEPPADKD